MGFGAPVENKQNVWEMCRNDTTLLCFLKNLFLLLQIGLITSYSLWAASRTFGVFLLSRIIGGISKGNVSLSTAIVADLHSPKARSKGMVSYI